ncbi:hypothetical protein IMZ48_25180, partial [Candidatus Bathyarchaeota archaeon]|nr:hypothetical protein [Candidatus Bathyarchaeota archaeon]
MSQPSSPDPEAKNEDERMYGEPEGDEQTQEYVPLPSRSTLYAHAYTRARFADRPKNVRKTLPFSELFKTLFNPLLELRKGPSGPVQGRTKTRTGGVSVQEQKRHVIEKFISRWRNDVGDDFYPAMRLILPDKDRDRTVYGLKESNIAKLLVKLLKIDPKKSADAQSLLHWKLPGQD